MIRLYEVSMTTAIEETVQCKCANERYRNAECATGCVRLERTPLTEMKWNETFTASSYKINMNVKKPLLKHGLNRCWITIQNYSDLTRLYNITLKLNEVILDETFF